MKFSDFLNTYRARCKTSNVILTSSCAHISYVYLDLCIFIMKTLGHDIFYHYVYSLTTNISVINDYLKKKKKM